MGRRLLTACVLAVLVGACTANARAKVGTSESTSPSEESPSGFEGSSGAAPTAAAPPPSGSATPTPAPTASSSEPARVRPGCSLQCAVGNRGRVPAAEEARLTQQLADVTEALRQCVGERIPSMLLRFDSTGTITSFGVAHDPGGMTADSCIESINQRMPAVSYPGPAALRCTEHCKR
jgi:hypothetical protein